MYYPIGSDQLGYHYFPGTNNVYRLEAIKLRTGNLADGFQLREEYKDKIMNSDGIVIETE